MKLDIGLIWTIHVHMTRSANNATHECGELLMKAIHYAQAEWKGLMEYTKDGHYREGW